jgi:hypothetical protein
MDNELDGRLRRLQAIQADQAEQLSRLVDGQERIHRTLTELARLMTEPDDDAVLHSVLASLVRAIEANTSTLNDLAQNFSRKP